MATKQVTAILIGAGSRGQDAYGSYAINYPQELRFVAVAEPNEQRRQRFAREHGIGEAFCFASWEQVLALSKLADAALVCTQDHMHYHPTMRALELGYDVLLEKPMSPDLQECIDLTRQAQRCGRILSVCHVLRYTPFFGKLKQLLDDGAIGRLMAIQHNENVGYFHQAHSFVRGNWNNSETSSPMILAKCCHDMDILYWLVGAKCVSLASFGHLTHFKEENAPAGAPLRCLDGCPAEQSCPYHVTKRYLGEETPWLTAAVTEDMSLEGRIKALEHNDYGKCVYHSNNNVVDHQSVSMDFENQVTASFTMSAFTYDCTRTIKLMGERGEIRGHMEKNVIEVTDFLTGSVNTIALKQPAHGHGGGDVGIMRDFVRVVRGEAPGLTGAEVSLHSHLMAFAAEQARVERKVVSMNAFE